MSADFGVMQRPISGDSASIAHPTANGSMHKRHASVKVTTKTSGLSVISLFVANLRFLDVDRLPDWPNITASSFGTQDSRTRIKCVEYALYQLFKLYSPDIAAEKLKPFFPPLEPLQSVNLRAALFRCLNELKKSGILSKETVLRKSMLDDCQGERFWEVCLSFSALVLRRVSQEGRSRHARPISEKIGTARILSARQTESMLPLAIAHKAALARVLDEKQRKKEKYVGLHDLLSEKDSELKRRKIAARQQAQKTSSLQPAKLAAVEQAVERSWVGSIELKEALIQGDTCAKGDGLLVESFEQLWLQDSDKGSIVSNGADVGLLQDLNSKATQQSVRLSMWQNYLDRLIATKPTPARTNDATTEARDSVVSFARHRGLNLKETSNNDEDQPGPQPMKHQSAIRYDEILNAMREELRKNSTSRSATEPPKPALQLLKRAQTQPMPAHQRSSDPQASPGAQSHHSRSPSQTAVPVGPRLGRRVSFQSKSYEKPKVDGQREPIPLKSELFSPVKENRRSLTSLLYAASRLPSPAEEADSETIEERAAVSDTTAGAQDHLFTTAATSKVRDALDTPESNGTSGPTVLVKAKEDAKNPDHDFKIPTLPEKKVSTLQKEARPSLAERTRMSIAFNSSEDVTGFLPDLAATESTGLASSDDVPETAELQPPLDRRASLLQRTRQSISMAPTPQQAPKSKKSSHSRARSSLFPVNQFETPRKARSSTININGSEKRDVTPIEKLLSPDADYDSIFKSRPRVALSPVLSPYSDAELTRNVSSDLDMAASSPLVNVGGRA